MPGTADNGGGTWTFDLASLGDVTDDRGIALVADIEPGATFQVTFTTDVA